MAKVKVGSIEIDLTGIDHKFGVKNTCADCNKDWDAVEPCDETEEATSNFAFQIFRGEGKATKMLTLCWTPCAQLRMQKKALN